jgi:hypothetical protein
LGFLNFSLSDAGDLGEHGLNEVDFSLLEVAQLRLVLLLRGEVQHPSTVVAHAIILLTDAVDLIGEFLSDGS